ncbi:MAG TPA: hypothetical protein VFV43_10945 [Limnobacter sp.]|nr:hypothetical protein [Limnobacter sp.]
MSFQLKQGIVPQLFRLDQVLGLEQFAHIGHVAKFVLLIGMGLLVAGCASSIQLKSQAPLPPTTLQDAKTYAAGRERALEFLEYEINQQSIACYERFFVASCLDQVRLQGAQLRRAHLEVQGQAEDIIRLDEYAKRQNKDKQSK